MQGDKRLSVAAHLTSSGTGRVLGRSGVCAHGKSYIRYIGFIGSKITGWEESAERFWIMSILI